MSDQAGLAMHELARPSDGTAEALPDRLMAEADAEQRLAGRRTGRDQIKADARFVGGAGAGGDQEGLRTTRHRLADTDGVVANHLDGGTQLLEVMDEVPGEAVVIVDDEDHDPRDLALRGPNARAPNAM